MKKYLLAASAAMLAAGGAQAATFVWSSGTYQSGVTSPNPLLAPDILSLQTGNDKTSLSFVRR